MEPDEVALSDVHIYTENQSTPDHTAGDNLYPGNGLTLPRARN